MTDEVKKEEQGNDETREAEPFTLQELYAFVSKNEDGSEGIIGMPSPQGVVPMFTADEKHLPKLLEGAQLFANHMNRQITVLKFSVREEHTVLEPSMLVPPDAGIQRIRASMSAKRSDDILKQH